MDKNGLSSVTKNFNNWNYFAGAINKIKDFENQAWPIFGGVIDNELRRMAHRQFPWQSKLGPADFVRYF